MAKPEIKKSAVLDPLSINPENAMEYASRGWLFYSNQDFEKAIDDFHHVLEEERNDLDTWYGLGLALKAEGSANEAVAAFNRVLTLTRSEKDKQRANIIKRLATGQINHIKTGDWNLEKEVWKRS